MDHLDAAARRRRVAIPGRAPIVVAGGVQAEYALDSAVVAERADAGGERRRVGGVPRPPAVLAVVAAGDRVPPVGRRTRVLHKEQQSYDATSQRSAKAFKTARCRF